MTNTHSPGAQTVTTAATAAASLHREFTSTLIDLASARLGGETLACSDDFFAPMENLIKPGRGVFIEDKYTDRGKWMDGWESRRRFGRINRQDSERDHDWCLLRLGVAGAIRGLDVDTNHFRGNAPQSVSVQACHCTQALNASAQWQATTLKDSAKWIDILPQRPVAAHSQNLFRIVGETIQAQTWTHLRLNIFPDGGVARLRVYGDPKPDWSRFLPGEPIDLAAIANGGRALLCSDMFYSDKNNLLMPGRGVNMGDGWETRRRRDQGNDWVIVKLACAGRIGRVLIDTHHFKGNFPDRFSLEGTVSDSDDFNAYNGSWETIIPPTPLAAHREHLFIEEVVCPPQRVYTHVRLNIFPDGGVSRLRIFGYPREAAQ
ncbi:MAG: allantoicase [Exilibacterium sp.]